MSLPDPAATESCDAPRPQADNACRLGARLVWAVPRSLAATNGIACCFLFLGVLRWFTSPRWPSRSYVFTPEWRSMTSAGFSHSEILGSKPVCSSPRLIAAGRVLHRLSAPRHPPCTLSSLTKSQNCTLETSTLRFRRSHIPGRGRRERLLESFTLLGFDSVVKDRGYRWDAVFPPLPRSQES